MVGGYLRTNYRRTGGKLDKDALGRGFAGGSWIAGAGVADVYGVVAGSFSGNFTSNIISIEAASALASFYGCDKMNPLTGYRIFPFMVKARPGHVVSTSTPTLFATMTTSAGASQMLILAGGSDASVYTGSADGGCIHFNWFGLIISAP